jgi:hypothetical protein
MEVSESLYSQFFLKNPLIAVQTGNNQTILRELDNSHACKNTDWDDKLNLCVCMYIGFCVQLCMRKKFDNLLCFLLLFTGNQTLHIFSQHQ